MTMQVPIPLLLFAPSQTERMPGASVPKPEANLFSRIIRNHPRPDLPMRERLCAEMLCGILQNCSQLRNTILLGFAESTNQDIRQFSDLEWSFDTECSIGNKRDDLRIEGFMPDADDRRPVVLWTVEVKVAASFHASSDQSESQEEETEGDRSPVNQIKNYDDWLAMQSAQHRSGFVLAVNDLSQQLSMDFPEGLNYKWPCLTWTWLAETIYDSIKTRPLPEPDAMLARHLLGFIQQHLWSSTVATEKQLTFDHIAFIRANNAMGSDVNNCVRNLIAPVKEIMNQSSMTTVDAIPAETLFGFHNRVAYKSCLSSSPEEIFVWAGLSGNAISVWIETNTKHPKKDGLRREYERTITSLKSPNSSWQFDVGPPSWWDVYSSMSLEALLATDDQQAQVSNFVREALDDLADAGIPELIRVCLAIT